MLQMPEDLLDKRLDLVTGRDADRLRGGGFDQVESDPEPTALALAGRRFRGAAFGDQVAQHAGHDPLKSPKRGGPFDRFEGAQQLPHSEI